LTPSRVERVVTPWAPHCYVSSRQGSRRATARIAKAMVAALAVGATGAPSSAAAQPLLSLARAADHHDRSDCDRSSRSGSCAQPLRCVYEVAPTQGCCSRESRNVVDTFDEVLATAPDGGGWSVVIEYDWSWRPKEGTDGSIVPAVTDLKRNTLERASAPRPVTPIAATCSEAAELSGAGRDHKCATARSFAGFLRSKSGR